MVVTFKEENTIAFKHLFLKGYIDRMDDTYAVYTQRDVYDQIIFAVNQVSQTRAFFTLEKDQTGELLAMCKAEADIQVYKGEHFLMKL